MIRHAAILLIIIGVLLWASIGFCHQSENANLYMTKAIYALNIGDDARAFSWFGKVVSIQPDNITALYLQGVCASRLGRYAQAEAILKSCISKEGAPLEAHYDLGFVLYSQGRYREAAVQFDIAYRNEMKEQALPYYLGASLFKIKEYDRAVVALEGALDTVPDVESNIRYYLGASYFALKKYRKSQINLEKCLELNPGPKVTKSASELLAAAIREKALAKWWDIRLELGMAYDTNVLFEPDELEVTDQAGFYGYSTFDVTVYPLKARYGTIGTGYSYFQSIHYDPENEVLGDFDLLRHAGRLEGQGTILRGLPGLYLGLDYELSYATLGGQHYQDQHQVFPYIDIIESRLTATRFSSTIKLKRFSDFQERDGTFYGPSITQMFNFMRNKGKSAFEVGYQQNDAESDFYDYRGVKFYGGAIIPIVSEFYGIAGAQYGYLDYLYHPERRIDRKMVGEFGLKYIPREFFAIQSRYRFARNQSLERYTWQKHVISLSFIVQF